MIVPTRRAELVLFATQLLICAVLMQPVQPDRVERGPLNLRDRFPTPGRDLHTKQSGAAGEHRERWNPGWYRIRDDRFDPSRVAPFTSTDASIGVAGELTRLYLRWAVGCNGCRRVGVL